MPQFQRVGRAEGLTQVIKTGRQSKADRLSQSDSSPDVSPQRPRNTSTAMMSNMRTTSDQGPAIEQCIEKNLDSIVKPLLRQLLRDCLSESGPLPTGTMALSARPTSQTKAPKKQEQKKNEKNGRAEVSASSAVGVKGVKNGYQAETLHRPDVPLLPPPGETPSPEQLRMLGLDDDDDFHAQMTKQVVATTPKADKRKLQAEVALIRAQIRSEPWTVDPNSAIMQRWDVVTMFALLFTAIAAPFEVAFLKFDESLLFTPSLISLTVYWVFGKMLDMVFLFDMVLQFFTRFQTSHRQGSKWITDRARIRAHYVKTWFPIDFVSTLPYDLVGMTVGGDTQQMRSLKMVRLLRLLKMFRLLRASRIISRWETKVGLSYAQLALVKFVVLALFTAHWIACVWGIVPQIAPEDEKELSWIVIHSTEDAHPFTNYAMALYVAMIAIGSGVGSITPSTTTEYMAIVVCILAGSSVWAYIIGSICGVISTLDKHGIAFRNDMDDLNYFMNDKRLDYHLQIRLREYFHQSRQLMRCDNYQDLMSKMSDCLRGEVALKMSHEHLKKVGCFKNAEPGFLVSVSLAMSSCIYAARESIPPLSLGIVVRGVAARGGRIMGKGAIFGEDMILSSDRFKDMTFLAALSYVEVSELQKSHLDEIMNRFPKTKRQIRFSAIMLAFKRYMHEVAMMKKRERSNLGVHNDFTAVVEGAVHHQYLQAKWESQQTLMGLEDYTTKIMHRLDALQTSQDALHQRMDALTFASKENEPAALGSTRGNSKGVMSMVSF